MFAKPRKRSNDGGGSRVVSAKLALPRNLENEYLAQRAAEAAARHEKRLEKEAPKCRRGPQRSLPDAVVLALRALRDYRMWSVRQLAAYFQIPEWKARHLCAYTTMLDLVPDEAHVPADAVKPEVKDGRGRPRKSKPAATVSEMMVGTYRALEAVRAQKRGVDPAELRMGEEG